MSSYKLIQDIEAEDKILGPLTLRQFIFALIACFAFYLCFIVVTKGVAFLLVVFLPPALFFGFFALPFGRDQPTEVWFLAKLQFWFKPRRRIWNQSGVKELVTITVPKKVERVLTNGLSQDEVNSRLRALANTIDSRGWAIKNVNTFGPQPMAALDSDRLIDIASIPQEVPSGDVFASDDIMDPDNNPIAHQFDTLINQSSQAHRQQLIDQISPAGSNQSDTPKIAPTNKWFMSQGGDSVPTVTAPSQLSTVASAADDPALAARLKAHASEQDVAYSNLRTLKPLRPHPVKAGHKPAHKGKHDATSTVTAPSDPAILALANNNDFNVETLAREAQKAKHDEDQSSNEVVISLR